MDVFGYEIVHFRRFKLVFAMVMESSSLDEAPWKFGVKGSLFEEVVLAVRIFQ